MTIESKHSLPDPLVPADCDLRDFQFMPMDIMRLFNSEFHALSNDSEWRAGVTLWMKSYHQVPAASIPDDVVYELLSLISRFILIDGNGNKEILLEACQVASAFAEYDEELHKCSEQKTR